MKILLLILVDLHYKKKKIHKKLSEFREKQITENEKSACLKLLKNFSLEEYYQRKKIENKNAFEFVLERPF